ncbi:hypothetical protein AVEN_142160-1 [Araneus ventricosus]|uniref:Uncharacterized protein n=1 Tax=Araneus ventricosus TaxID=182803 RepID=A0A4Y2IJ26_ARAVE|nr:hypothetical protein AVEN_142160-1 [Araneus ventricosus]
MFHIQNTTLYKICTLYGFFKSDAVKRPPAVSDAEDWRGDADSGVALVICVWLKHPPAVSDAENWRGNADSCVILVICVWLQHPKGAFDAEDWRGDADSGVNLVICMWLKRPPSGLMRRIREGMPTQVSSSLSAFGSKLRNLSQNSPCVTSKRDINRTKLN